MGRLRGAGEAWGSGQGMGRETKGSWSRVDGGDAGRGQGGRTLADKLFPAWGPCSGGWGHTCSSWGEDSPARSSLGKMTAP